MLSLLDARLFGRVLFIAEFQGNSESLFMWWTLLASQPVLVLNLGTSAGRVMSQLIDI